MLQQLCNCKIFCAKAVQKTLVKWTPRIECLISLKLSTINHIISCDSSMPLSSDKYYNAGMNFYGS